MRLRYGLDDLPPAGETALYALQWLAISLPSVVIIGAVAAGPHSASPEANTLYLQKAAFVTGLLILGQALFGHRLTLVAGPSTALLLGIVGSRSHPAAAYTAAAICGVVLAIVSAAGVFGTLRKRFTPRVTATVILLIAFTLTPTIVGLLTSGSRGTAGGRIVFAAAFVSALFLAHRFLPLSVRSLVIIMGMAVGAAAFRLVFGAAPSGGAAPAAAFAAFVHGVQPPVFDAGTTVAFLFCFLALSLNEIGSMQAVAPLLQPDGTEGRIRRGMTVAGVVNAVGGMLGVVGPVDFSLSPGVIAASGCGSRFPLFGTAVLLFLASFSPAVLAAADAIPSVVVGGILVYALSGQIAAGLNAVFVGHAFEFEDGLVIGLPLLAGTVAAILPRAVIAQFPPLMRSVAGNGFVVGIVAVLLLDRLFRGAAGNA